MFGQIKLENFDACRLTQKAASAWTAVGGLAGASYKPLLYLGETPYNGTLYSFVAEQTLTTYPVIRRVVKLTIHEVGDDFEVIKESITQIA